jgi:hypothetical protein
MQGEAAGRAGGEDGASAGEAVATATGVAAALAASCDGPHPTAVAKPAMARPRPRSAFPRPILRMYRDTERHCAEVPRSPLHELAQNLRH